MRLTEEPANSGSDCAVKQSLPIKLKGLHRTKGSGPATLGNRHPHPRNGAANFMPPSGKACRSSCAIRPRQTTPDRLGVSHSQSPIPAHHSDCSDSSPIQNDAGCSDYPRAPRYSATRKPVLLALAYCRYDETGTVTAHRSPGRLSL